MKVNIEPKGAFATALVKAMEERGVSIRDLSVKAGATYEHIRKLVSGLASPSTLMLRTLCEETGLPVAECEKMVVRDKLQRKYGGIPRELAGKSPGMSDLEDLWKGLTKEQQNSLTEMARALARQNRAKGITI